MSGIITDIKDGIAVITLNRPERHNAIDEAAATALTATWRDLRMDDTVRAAIITGSGTQAFSTGLDRSTTVPQPHSPYSTDDLLVHIGPKANDLWIPVIAAVEGMACGGAFYLLSESEFIIAAETATFFDPHTTYGMVSAYEAMAMAQRMPFGEAARMSLMGTAERLSAHRAHTIGLVSELTAPGESLDAARNAAATLASYPTTAVQGTVRALWAAKSAARSQAMAQAPHLIALGSLRTAEQAELFTHRTRSTRHSTT